jgi:hypothetical protein
MYGRSKYILAGLGTVLAAQFAAGLWQYTLRGGRVAPDPINNYEFHCQYPFISLSSLSSILILPHRLHLSPTRLPRLRIRDVRLLRPQLQHPTLRLNTRTNVLRLLASAKCEGREFVVEDARWEWRDVLWVSYFKRIVCHRYPDYFTSVIFCLNLSWALMILFAPTGLRGVFSQ